jgi:hypothetical protein
MVRPFNLIGISILLVAGLAGCGRARYVVREQGGGIVAIPSNTNGWPYYHRDKANELMTRHFPQGYIIDREEEVVVGTVTESREATNAETSDTKDRKGQKSGTAVSELTTSTTTTRDQTEWRIWYHGK